MAECHELSPVGNSCETDGYSQATRDGSMQALARRDQRWSDAAQGGVDAAQSRLDRALAAQGSARMTRRLARKKSLLFRAVQLLLTNFFCRVQQ